MAAERLAIKDLSELPPTGTPVMKKGALRVMKEAWADLGCLYDRLEGIKEFHDSLEPDPRSVQSEVRATLETLRSGDEEGEPVSGENAVPASVNYLRKTVELNRKGMIDATRESILEQALLDVTSGKLTEAEFAVIQEQLKPRNYMDRDEE
ncbi:hypothetical protein KJ835_00620 [Patescibacteria group bacterium]|nr:hypothetical protein [Patescibacteria group bacterium]MBU1954228.1 hypothetical protein [Patescibacteria group bacterium]